MELSISQLADQAGVSVRTVRYYIEEGLLPPPQVRGRNAYYEEDYLYRLILIQKLKQAFLPLAEIRRRLDQLTPQQVRALLAEDASQDPNIRTPARPITQSSLAEALGSGNDSAASYIARVLSNQAQPPSAPRPIQRRGEEILPSTAPTIALETRESAWLKIELANGVELHLRQPLDTQFAGRVQQLILYAKRLFDTRRPV
jgi:DNA-binding transcriptional MerR regulator